MQVQINLQNDTYLGEWTADIASIPLPEDLEDKQIKSSIDIKGARSIAPSFEAALGAIHREIRFVRIEYICKYVTTLMEQQIPDTTISWSKGSFGTYIIAIEYILDPLYIATAIKFLQRQEYLKAFDTTIQITRWNSIKITLE